MNDQASKLLRIVGTLRDIADQDLPGWRAEVRAASAQLEALASAHGAEGAVLSKLREWAEYWAFYSHPEMSSCDKGWKNAATEVLGILNAALPPPKVPNYESIVQAVARGWCHPANAKKVMDPELALAISNEVAAMLAASKVSK